MAAHTGRERESAGRISSQAKIGEVGFGSVKMSDSRRKMLILMDYIFMFGTKMLSTMSVRRRKMKLIGNKYFNGKLLLSSIKIHGHCIIYGYHIDI